MCQWSELLSDILPSLLHDGYFVSVLRLPRTSTLFFICVVSSVSNQSAVDVHALRAFTWVRVSLNNPCLSVWSNTSGVSTRDREGKSRRDACLYVVLTGVVLPMRS